MVDLGRVRDTIMEGGQHERTGAAGEVSMPEFTGAAEAGEDR